jgi:hypothetical protein
VALATYQDVAVALGRPISDTAEQNQVERWLTGIELVLAVRLGTLSALDQEALLYVEVEAAATKVRHHGSLESSITVSVDDGSVTRRYDSPVSDSDISEEWWNLLLGVPSLRGTARVGWLA